MSGATPGRGMRALLAALSVAVLASCQAQGPGGGVAAPAPPQLAAPTDLEVGQSLLAAGQPEMALGAFNRSIARAGVSAEALLGAGIAYIRIGQRREARRFIEAAVKLDPENPMARNNLGVLLHAEGEFAAALAEFTRAYALTGGADPRIRDNLGMAELALEERGEVAVVDEAEFDVIQYGHGVYRLEPRERAPAADTPQQDNTAETTAPEAQS